jgi:5-methylcytosine-specific restriction protein A
MARAEYRIPDSIATEHVKAAAAALDSNVDHPFHESTKVDVLIDNQRYPPKAILGIASKLAANVDLTPADFTGGIGSKCFRILENLGFRIVPKWNIGESHHFIPGRVYNRKKDIHDVYGGSRQSGIVTTNTSSFIFLFTSSIGDSYGYRDGWTEDGVFLFTGEGQKGDQTFTRGNKAIRDHIRESKTLELFESLGKGKDYRFIGSFMCDSWETQRGPDIAGIPRETIVFHLVPLVAEPSESLEPANFPTSIEELRRLAMFCPRRSSVSSRCSLKPAILQRSVVRRPL